MKLALTVSLKLYPQQPTYRILNETSIKLVPRRISWARTRLCQPRPQTTLSTSTPLCTSFLNHNLRLTRSSVIITQNLVSLSNRSTWGRTIVSSPHASRGGTQSLALQGLILRPSPTRIAELVSFWRYFCSYVHFLRTTQILLVLFTRRSVNATTSTTCVTSSWAGTSLTSKLSSDRLRLDVLLRNV